MRDLREQCLLGAAGAVRRLPNFRGKVRLLMELHKLLGLERRHFPVSTTIHRPVPFKARLDLFCLHERMAYFMDRYEPGTVEFLRRLWRPGETFFDIGANVGLIALPFTLSCRASGGPRAGGGGRKLTYCVEAVAANRESLAHNIGLNDLGDEIEVIGSAVGEVEKDVEIQVEGNLKPGEGTGTANIIAEGSAHPCERIPLHLTTIDRLVREGRLPGQCGLLKIDTDGYDLFALKGGRRFLAEARPIIYGEFSAHCMNWHGQTIGDVEAYLGPLGYRVFTRRSGWTFGPLGDGSPYVQDALCLPAEKLERAAWCIPARDQGARPRGGRSRGPGC